MSTKRDTGLLSQHLPDGLLNLTVTEQDTSLIDERNTRQVSDFGPFRNTNNNSQESNSCQRELPRNDIVNKFKHVYTRKTLTLTSGSQTQLVIKSECNSKHQKFPEFPEFSEFPEFQSPKFPSRISSISRISRITYPTIDGKKVFEKSVFLSKINRNKWNFNY